MKRLLILAALMLLWAASAFGQTTINLQVTDAPDNQTWNNGTWTVKLIPAPGNLSQTGTFTLTGAGSLSSQNGSLSSTGAASFTLPANANIAPLSNWQFTVCSQAGTACSIANITVTTSSPQSVTISPPSIRVAAQPNLPPIVVYTTTEVASASIGSQITVVGSTPSTPALQICTVISGSSCTTWAAAGSTYTGPGSNVFNVKNFGAFGNTQSFVGTFTLGGGNTTLTCAGCNFTAADVTNPQKIVYGSNNSFGVNWFAKISAVNAGVATITGFTQVAGATGNVLVWGQLDEGVSNAVGTALSTSINAYNANIVTGTQSSLTQGIFGLNSQAPTVYFPSGGYMICAGSNAVGFTSFLTLNGNTGSSFAQVVLTGDPISNGGMIQSPSTVIYPCPNPPAASNKAWLVINANGGNLKVTYQNLQIEGAYVDFPVSQYQQLVNGNSYNVGCSEVGHFNATASAGCFVGTSQSQFFAASATNDGGPGYIFQGTNIEVHMSRSSNSSGGGVSVQNVTGATGGAGFRWIGGQLDEVGCHSVGRNGNVSITNSYDVWFVDMSAFTCTDGAPGFSMDIDGTSVVHVSGDVFGPFSAGSGVRVQSGGKLIATDTRFYTFNVANATDNCLTNNGTFINLGGNRCETFFSVSGTSAGTTATLTTTQNHRLTAANIGDFISVAGMSVAGYNCANNANLTNFCFQITGVPSATTLTYTTSGSNIGAGTGGSMYVNTWNGAGFSGNPPVSDLTPSWNTYYITASPFAGATMGSQPNDRPTYMTKVRATSGVTTTCATPPVLTITNSNVTTTFTLTSGQSVWDTSVTPTTFPIASGSMPMYFAPTLPSGANSPTISITTGTCATPPTNFAVTLFGNSPGLP